MGNAQAVVVKCCHCKEYGMFFCYDCKKVMCCMCTKDHVKHTSINRHFVIEYKYVNHQLLKTDLNCCKHGKSFTLYCSPCQTLVCNECVITSHAQHQFCDITTIVKEAVDDFSAVQSKLQEKRKILMSKKTKIKAEMIPALNTKKESIQQEMHNSVFKLKKIIDTVEEVTENGKEEIYVDELNKLTTAMKEIERIENKYSSTLELINTTLSEKHHIGFLNFYQSIKGNVNSLEEIIDTVEDGNIPAFDFNDFTHKVINSMLLDMGESKLQDKNDAINDLQDKEKQLSQQIQCMQTTTTNNNITIQNLQAENQQLKIKLQDNDDAIKDLKEKEKRFSQQIRCMETTSSNNNITIKNLQKENKNIRSSLQQTKERMKSIEIELQQKIEDLEFDLDDAYEEKKQACDRWESKFEDKNREMEKCQNDTKQLYAKMKRRQRIIQQLEEKNESLARINSDLKKKIKSLQRIDVNRAACQQRMSTPEQLPVISHKQFHLVRDH